MKGNTGTPMVAFSPFKKKIDDVYLPKKKNTKQKITQNPDQKIKKRKQNCILCFYHQPLGYCRMHLRYISQDRFGRRCRYCKPLKKLNKVKLDKLQTDLEILIKQRELAVKKKNNRPF